MITNILFILYLTIFVYEKIMKYASTIKKIKTEKKLYYYYNVNLLVFILFLSKTFGKKKKRKKIDKKTN